MAKAKETEKKATKSSSVKAKPAKKAVKKTVKKVAKTIAKKAVKKAAKPEAKKTAAKKKPVKKTVAKKVAAKKAVKKTVLKKVAKKAATKPVAKKTASKKAVKKTVIKKTATKSEIKKPVKAVAKKTIVKKTKRKVAKKITAIPKGCNVITPYIIVNQALDAIEFYKNVFGAKELLCMKDKDGHVMHAELKFGDTRIMLADESVEMNMRAPQSFGGSPISIHIYVSKVDDVVDRALTAGAILADPVEDRYYGDRSGAIIDPFGHLWFVSTHVENVTPAKMKKRIADIIAQQKEIALLEEQLFEENLVTEISDNEQLADDQQSPDNDNHHSCEDHA